MKKAFILVWVLGLVGLVGCSSTGSKLKPGMVWCYAGPIVKCQKDPDAKFEQYATFSTVSGTGKEKRGNPIEEKQLLFLVRCNLEMLGYTFVDDPEKADLLITLWYANEYKSEYIPPSSYTVPYYVPGQTYNFNYSGNSYAYGSAWGPGGSAYGSAYGTHYGTGTVTTPGRFVPMTVNQPGYYTGAYYPFIDVGVLDRNEKKLVWTGNVIASTPEMDIRKSGQVLLCRLLIGVEERTFPPSPKCTTRDDTRDGIFGVFPWIITEDGNDFYSRIERIYVDSPAYRQGARPYDIITCIDGKNMTNKPPAYVLSAMDKAKGEIITFTLKRDDRVFEIKVQAEDEKVAKAKWKVVKYIDGEGKVKSRRIDR